MALAAGNIYSFEHAQFYRITSTGFACGTGDPDALVNGTTYSAYKVKGVVTCTLPEASYIEATFKGGGVFEGKAQMGIDDLGQGEMGVSTLDDTLNALLMGGSVDSTTVTNHIISALNSQNPSPNQVGLILSTRLQSRVAATDGTNEWLNIIIPKCQARTKMPNLSGEGGVNPNAPTIVLTPNASTVFPVGVAMGSNQGWTNNKEMMYFDKFANPIAITTFVQDASAVTFILGYRPVKSTVTSGITDNWTTVNGTPTAMTSINVTTGVVTKAAAGTAAQLTVAMYPTNFTAI